MQPSTRPVPARAPLLLLGLTAVLAACSVLPSASLSPRDAILRTLAERQAQWQSKNVDDYTFTISRQCFCPFTEPLVVTVVDGVATAITKAGQPAAEQDAVGLPTTVPALFAVVATNASAAKLSVEWDVTFGFPTSIQVDADLQVVDEEFGFQITNLRPAS
jgi:hypothetical protein